jgi:hypothetical protein
MYGTFSFHTVLIPGFRMRSLETNIGLCFVRDLQHSLLRIEKHRCFKPISPVYLLAHFHTVSCCALTCFTYHVPAVLLSASHYTLASPTSRYTSHYRVFLDQRLDNNTLVFEKTSIAAGWCGRCEFEHSRVHDISFLSCCC